MAQRFGIQAFSMAFLGYRDATDLEIFAAARVEGAVVMTKDHDFLRLLEERGSPPRVLWVTLGNTSNERMKAVLERTFPQAVALLENGEPLVEIRDLPA